MSDIRPAMADPLDILKRYHAAIDRLDFQAIETMFAVDARYVSPGLSGTVEGRDAILQAFRRYFDEYGDQVSVDEQAERVSATQARSVWRLAATSATTGTRLERRGRETIRVDDEGKIVEVVVTDE